MQYFTMSMVRGLRMLDDLYDDYLKEENYSNSILKKIRYQGSRDMFQTMLEDGFSIKVIDNQHYVFFESIEL